jgi:hypothetical protein
MIVLHVASHPAYEVILHEHCRTCGQPYIDNCRTSKDCDTCKPFVKAARNKARNRKKAKR